MHSKKRYKICICSVIRGELEAFRNYKGFSVIFPKILDVLERENFSYSSRHHIFESENFRFPFSTKISLTQGVKYEQLNSRKSLGTIVVIYIWKSFYYQIYGIICPCFVRGLISFLR